MSAKKELLKQKEEHLLAAIIKKMKSGNKEAAKAIPSPMVVKSVLQAFRMVAIDELRQLKIVTLTDFGDFIPKKHAEKMQRSNATKKQEKFSARISVSLKLAESLKKVLRDKHEMVGAEKSEVKKTVPTPASDAIPSEPVPDPLDSLFSPPIVGGTNGPGGKRYRKKVRDILFQRDVFETPKR